MFDVGVAQPELEDPVGPAEEIAHRFPDFSVNPEHTTDMAHLASTKTFILFTCKAP